MRDLGIKEGIEYREREPFDPFDKLRTRSSGQAGSEQQADSDRDGQAEVDGNYRSQINHNDRNSNTVWVIGSWILEFICNLVLEIWDYGFRNV